MDPDWIARTLAEQAISHDALPSETIGRAELTSDERTLPGVADLASSLPSIQLRDEACADPDSPHLYVRGRLGEGGMGIVELAHQPLLDRDVAVKRLSRADSSRAAALLREARVTGSLEHPNITPIHTIGHDPRLGPVVVMKRIQGHSWSEVLAREREQLRSDEDTLAAHVEILTRVCRAVEFAHSRGLAHRDLKPSNVMLGEFGELYVVDWGLALELGAEAPTRLVGSPAYMAPEMAAAPESTTRVDPRADVYLLGATLHEILTGTPRHAAPTLLAALMLATESAPHSYDPAMPEELGQICNRACARDPEQRFADVASLRRALQQYLEHRRATAVLRAAARQHEQLRAMLHETRGSASDQPETELGAAYQKVVIRYEQALDIWGDLAAAREGRRQVMLEMLDYELERANIHGAQRIVDELKEVPKQHRVRLDALIEARHDTEARLSSLEQEVDLRTAEPARLRLLTGIIVTVALMNIGFFILDPTLSANSPPERLITLAAIIFTIATLLVLPGWRRLTDNLAGRQYIRFVAVSIGLVFVNRVCGYMLADTALSIMSTDLLLIGTTLCAIRLPLPGMVPVGVAVVSAGVAMTALPAYARLIFLIVTSAIPLTLLALDRRYRSQS